LDGIDYWMDGHRKADTHCDWYTKLMGNLCLNVTPIRKVDREKGQEDRMYAQRTLSRVHATIVEVDK